jgi:hypothetical protein
VPPNRLIIKGSDSHKRLKQMPIRNTAKYRDGAMVGGVIWFLLVAVNIAAILVVQVIPYVRAFLSNMPLYRNSCEIALVFTGIIVIIIKVSIISINLFIYSSHFAFN